MKAEMIAPCGMNCSICKGYLREKKKCPGCLGINADKPSYRGTCIIRNCEVIRTNKSGYCYECDKYPCRRLKQLDKRYSTKYSMSMLENLNCIRDKGMEKLLEKEQRKWSCPECDGVVSCHDGLCYSCGKDVLGRKRAKAKGG